MPTALLSEIELNEHAGGRLIAGEPLRVMLVQERVTLLISNPPNGVTVIVELASVPGAHRRCTGDSAEAAISNSASSVTCRIIVALLVSPAEVTTLTVYDPAAVDEGVADQVGCASPGNRHSRRIEAAIGCGRKPVAGRRHAATEIVQRVYFDGRSGRAACHHARWYDSRGRNLEIRYRRNSARAFSRIGCTPIVTCWLDGTECV